MNCRKSIVKAHHETVFDLIVQMNAARERLKTARMKIREAQKAMTPFQRELASAWNHVPNLECRLKYARERAKAKSNGLRQPRN